MMPLKLNPIALYHLYARRAVAVLSAVVVISAFCYGFFLLEAVSHAASQASIRREVQTLSSHVGSLQTKYLAATKALTPERAGALGFVAPKDVSTVYAAPVDGLSVNR